MNYRNLTALLAGLALVSCAPMTVEPAISSFNEASVAVQLNGNAMDFSDPETKANAIAKANAVAADTCRRGPNRKSELASSRNIPTGDYSYVIERLYLCLR